MPDSIVRIEAPARLHFGMLDLGGSLGRRFGGIGAGVFAPSLLVELERADAVEAKGPSAERAEEFARRALAAMKVRAAQIADGEAGELVWLLEHPPLYTAGVSAKTQDLIAPDLLPVFESGRGGQYTYHGPGQRVAYLMLEDRQRAV